VLQVSKILFSYSKVPRLRSGVYSFVRCSVVGHRAAACFLATKLRYLILFSRSHAEGSKN